MISICPFLFVYLMLGFSISRLVFLLDLSGDVSKGRLDRLMATGSIIDLPLVGLSRTGFAIEGFARKHMITALMKVSSIAPTRKVFRKVVG